MDFKDTNDNNNDSNNGSIYSKFRERLRKIKLARLEKQKQNKQFIDDKVKEIRKEATGNKRNYVLVNNNYKTKDDSLNEVVINIKATVNDRNYNRKKAVISEDNIYIDNLAAQLSNQSIINISKVDNTKTSINNELDVQRLYIKENKPKIKRNKKGIDVEILKNNISNIEKQKLLDDKAAEIIDKLKKNFEDKIDELEVLSSELYLLSKLQNEEIELKKVEEIKNKINEEIKRINEIINQYNLLKKNYYIENVIELDDSILIDDIIEYRELLDNFDMEKKFVKEYKNLDEFKLLYSRLVDIKDETELLKEANEEKIVEYGIRDKKYDEIKLSMISALDIDKKCSLEIDRQNEYFNKIIKDISAIKREEYVTSHLRGIGDLVNQSLRYMGLLVISPLAGLIPGIAMQTLVARRMIGNVYNQIHIENVKHIKYYATNYDSELNHHLNSISYTEKLIDDTLWDIDNTISDFKNIYNSSIPGYEDTLKKLSEIRKKIVHNQNRVLIVKKNLNKSKNLNNDKLSLVKKLNDAKK